MATKTTQKDPKTLIDPISELPGFDETESRIAVLGHPIHAMSVAFPVALRSAFWAPTCFIGGPVTHSGHGLRFGLREPDSCSACSQGSRERQSFCWSPAFGRALRLGLTSLSP